MRVPHPPRQRALYPGLRRAEIPSGQDRAHARRQGRCGRQAARASQRLRLFAGRGRFVRPRDAEGVGRVPRRVHSQNRKIMVPESGTERKTGSNSGYIKCNLCHGTGRQKAPTKKRAAPIKRCCPFYSSQIFTICLHNSAGITDRSFEPFKPCVPVLLPLGAFSWHGSPFLHIGLNLGSG